MTENEIQIFRELDDKLYLVSKNNTYNKIFRGMAKNIEDRDVQNFINKLAGWYLVKYSNNHICSYLNNRFDEIDYLQEEIMSLNKLIYRLNLLISRDSKDADLFYKQLIIMAGWGMIYSKNTIPEYGYFRVNKMFSEFNNAFNLNLDVNIYKSTMELDYSLNNPDIVKLLEIKQEKQKKEKRISRVKKLFRK